MPTMPRQADSPPGLDVHLPVVQAVCPDGHKTGTQKPSGAKLRCGQCWQEHGREVMVTVPRRDGDPPPRPAARKVCRACGASASGLPPGWVSLLVAADPAKTRDGKPRRVLGPYCSAACIVAGLRAAGPLAGVAASPGHGADIRQLMTEIPRGAR